MTRRRLSNVVAFVPFVAVVVIVTALLTSRL
jgi:hypothetical protein